MFSPNLIKKVRGLRSNSIHGWWLKPEHALEIWSIAFAGRMGHSVGFVSVSGDM